MHSLRKVNPASMPEAPVFPKIERVPRKPIQTKKHEMVDVGALTHHAPDEAAMSDLITPVNKGNVLPKKQVYKPKVNRNFRPNTKLLTNLERRANHQPREYTSIKSSAAGELERVGDGMKVDENMTLAHSGALKTERVNYTPIADFSVDVAKDYAGVLHIPSDTEVVPDLTSTLPVVSAHASSSYQYNKPQDIREIELTTKTQPIEMKATKSLPMNKPIDVHVSERENKFDNISLAASKNHYTQKIKVNEERNLEQKFTDVKTNKVISVPYAKQVDAGKRKLYSKNMAKDSDAGKIMPHAKQVHVADKKLVAKNVHQASSASKSAPHGKQVKVAEKKLLAKNMGTATDAGVELQYKKGVEAREYTLDSKREMQDIDVTKAIPVQKQSRAAPTVRYQDKETTSATSGHSGGYTRDGTTPVEEAIGAANYVSRKTKPAHSSGYTPRSFV